MMMASGRAPRTGRTRTTKMAKRGGEGLGCIDRSRLVHSVSGAREGVRRVVDELKGERDEGIKRVRSSERRVEREVLVASPTVARVVSEAIGSTCLLHCFDNVIELICRKKENNTAIRGEFLSCKLLLPLPEEDDRHRRHRKAHWQSVGRSALVAFWCACLVRNPYVVVVVVFQTPFWHSAAVS